MHKREVLAMTAVIYARYSSDNQREESIEGQIRECTAYAEKNGITIVKHYIDRAISAKTDNRPEFQQMIKDSDKKLFDIVLVWKLDRFARNRYDSARYKTQLKKNGVKLMSATEIISEGPEGIILESVLEGYAEYYSADLSEKVIRGMTENALKGKFTGGAIPFGYIINADHRFEIDPLTAPFVAETFQRYNDGQTMLEIRDWLNEKGVKNQRGGLMTFNTIQHMLNNRRYIGELKYRNVLIPDAILSIVSAELFNDVQEKMLKNKKAPARRKAEDDYLLTTKLDMSLKDQRQALVDTFINAIYLYDDKVLITFNYKEGTQTVTFEEAAEVASKGNGSDLDCIPALSKTTAFKKGCRFYFAWPAQGVGHSVKTGTYGVRNTVGACLWVRCVQDASFSVKGTSSDARVT